MQVTHCSRNTIKYRITMLFVYYRGRGGRGSHAHTSVDHRPTRLLVSGHESDEWKDVLAHFAVSIMEIVLLFYRRCKNISCNYQPYVLSKHYTQRLIFL
jgi:hypothetical protein